MSYTAWLGSLARPVGLSGLSRLLARWADSSVLLLSFSCNGSSEKRRNDAAHDVRRNTRHEFQETHSLSHTHTHTFVSSSPRHFQGTTSLPFNLVGTKTNLTCLWPSTLVNDFYHYFCGEFGHFCQKYLGERIFLNCKFLVFFNKKKAQHSKTLPTIAIIAYNMKGCLRFSTFIFGIWPNLAIFYAHGQLATWATSQNWGVEFPLVT
jgi:hypothetical protein